jgi:hypothetical protein
MLLGLDGQAHYSTAQLTAGRKWVYGAGEATFAVVNEGRWGGNPCIRRTNTTVNPTGHLQWAPFMTQSGPWTPGLIKTGVCGFAFKTLELARHSNPGVSGSNLGGVLKVMYGSTPHFRVEVNPDGTLGVYGYAPVGDFLLGTSLPALTDNTWAYLEVKWNLDLSGEITIRRNGVEVLHLTGAMYAPVLSHGLWTSVRLLELKSTAPNFMQCWLNDFYLLDWQGSGDQLRDFLGDVRVNLIVPDGVGASTAWLPSAGANWAAVDETPADDDTTYIASATSGHRDLYTYTNLPAGAVPLGFQTCQLARKMTEGTATLKPCVRSGGTTHDGPVQAVGSLVYGYTFQPYDTNPVTGARATASDLDAAEFGVLRV